MSEIKVDLRQYQKERTLFVVVKDFYKVGSAVMGFNRKDEVAFRYLLSRCDCLAKSPLQVVRISGPMALDGWGEYGPYTVYDNDLDLINICVSGDCPGIPNPFIEDSPYVKCKEDKELYFNQLLSNG